MPTCKQSLQDKIKINMGEYHDGRYSSREQAIAVSYKQVGKARPSCRRHLERKRRRKSSNESRSLVRAVNRIRKARRQSRRKSKSKRRSRRKSKSKRRSRRKSKSKRRSRRRRTTRKKTRRSRKRSISRRRTYSRPEMNPPGTTTIKYNQDNPDYVPTPYEQPTAGRSAVTGEIVRKAMTTGKYPSPKALRDGAYTDEELARARMPPERTPGRSPGRSLGRSPSIRGLQEMGPEMVPPGQLS